MKDYQKKIKFFKCIGCGTCCRWPGYVRLTEEEVDNIAAFLQLPVEEFIEKFTYLTEDRRNLSLIEDRTGACYFLNSNNRCTIQDVKPAQCKKFPFEWSFDGWEKICQAEKEFE